MKLKSTTLILFATLFCSYAYADTQPKKVPVNFSRIYVPNGFDDNDMVQIVGEGLFPNRCYRYDNSEIDVNHDTKVISIGPSGYKYDGDCLLPYAVSFDRVVELGLLKSGTYSIIRASDKSLLGQIYIRPATTEDADDYLYAPVSQAFLTRKDSANRLLLSGEFSMSCMKLKEVKPDLQSKVIVIQPIAEIDAGVGCKAGKFPFETEVDLGAIQKGRYLLHVRTMSGKALNSLVEIP